MEEISQDERKKIREEERRKIMKEMVWIEVWYLIELYGGS